MSQNNHIKKIGEALGLQVGHTVKDFSAMDIHDNIYILRKALENGPVVLIFIRGQWCPFCNKHLKQIQDKLPLIYAKGASVVVITPEKSEFIKQSIAKTGAEFTILYDEGDKIARMFDVLFQPNAVERFMYNTVMRAKLKESHSDDSEQLPIPATYIINQDFTIKWRHFNPDYKNRSKVDDIINQL